MIERATKDSSHGVLISVLRDRRLYFGTPAAVLGILLLANVLIARRDHALERAREENLLASARPASPNGTRYDASVGEQLERYLPAIPDARSQRLALVVGMSQMYAINERKVGDLTIAELLDEALRPHGVRAFGLAAPNLNNEEALFLLLLTAEQSATKPAFFVYGLCFDKMRNVDLRPGYLRIIRSSPALRAEWAALAERYGRRYPHAADKIRSTLATAPGDTAEAAGDSTFEQRLRARAEIVPMVREHKELNRLIMFDVLYKARNKALGITATTKRPMLPARYEANQQMLELLLDEARRRGVQPLTYVIPLNPQSENPYVAEEYAAFKTWAASVAATRGVPFANLENAVPREHWGLFMGGPDFKHFKGAGHRHTADSIMHRFGSVLLATPGDMPRRPRP